MRILAFAVLVLPAACAESESPGPSSPVGPSPEGTGRTEDAAGVVDGSGAAADGRRADGVGVEGGSSDVGGPVSPDSAGADGIAAPGDVLPLPGGPCPEFAPGMLTFRPGELTRQARVWISDAAERADGPLVFYWYGTNGSPAEAERALGEEAIAEILAAGGLVVAPVHDPAAGIWPWFLVAGARDLDVRIADEVVACAVEKVGIDRRRIHSVGFSAGAIHTIQLGYRRSGYIASVVTYSGALLGEAPDQDPTSKLAALIFHGGPSDRVVIGFQEGSERYKAALNAAGRFALLCNHGRGHQIPTPDVASTWRFLQDHPFGTSPSPYAADLPPEIPDSCSR